MKKQIKLPNAIWAYGLGSADLQVYVAVSGFANRLGHCCVRQETIAAAADVSVPTAARALKRLSGCGLISTSKRYDRRGFLAANGYTLVPLSGSFTMLPGDITGYRLPKSVFKVYLYLLRCRANNSLEALPSLSQMVSVLHMSKRTIIDSVNFLSSRLLLHKEKYQHKQDGRIGHNRYRVITAAVRSILVALLARCAGAKEKRTTLFRRAVRGAKGYVTAYKTKIAEMLANVKSYFTQRAVLWRIFIGTILIGQELDSPRLRLQLKSK